MTDEAKNVDNTGHHRGFLTKAGAKRLSQKCKFIFELFLCYHRVTLLNIQPFTFVILNQQS